MHALLVVFAGIALLPLLAHSQTVGPIWTNRYHGPGNLADFANAIAVDSNGDIYVTGDTSVVGGYSDYATVAYSSAGVPLWTNRYDGPAQFDDGAIAIAIAPGNMVVVTGGSTSSNYSSDYLTIAYTSVGLPLWTNRYDGPPHFDDMPYALAVATNGQIFVTGLSYGDGCCSDFATVAYSSAGVPLWTHRYNGLEGQDDYATAMAVTSDGTVIVTGDSYYNSGYYDYATVAYSSAGIPLWINRYNGAANNHDHARAVAVSESGNVVVTGDSTGSDGYANFATIAYSSAGTPLWTNYYDWKPNANDSARAVAAAPNGNLIVTGRSGVGYSDFVTIAYSDAGVPLWTNRYNGPSGFDDEPNAMVVDASGTVLVTGKSRYTGGIGFDYLTVAYSSAGILLWTNRYNGPLNDDDQTSAVAVSPNGDVVVTGRSRGDGTGYDYATIKYAAAPPTPLLITEAILDGSQLILGGTGGSSGSPLYVLTATNLADAPSYWSRVSTNYFDASGNFKATNTLHPEQGHYFFRIETP